MSPASLGGGGHIVNSRRYNLLLLTPLQSNALATLNDGASPLLNISGDVFMTYTISEVAEKMGVSAHTLRFYDKEGLLPNVDRVNGRRVFKDEDFAWLRVLNCLKNTGMPLKEIQRYLDLCKLGDDSLEDRLQLMLDQKKSIEDQIKFLEFNMKQLEYKIWYYEKAIEAGTEKIHEGHSCNPNFEPDIIPEK